jgi:hypothetical protein
MNQKHIILIVMIYDQKTYNFNCYDVDNKRSMMYDEVVKIIKVNSSGQGEIPDRRYSPRLVGDKVLY